MSRERLSLPLIEKLLESDEEGLSLEEKHRLLQTVTSDSPEHRDRLFQLLLSGLSRKGAECKQLQEGLSEARGNQKKLKEVLDKLCATPWHPALYLRTVSTSQGQRAIVLHNGSRRVVGLADEIEPDGLQKGEEVFLSSELNVIIAESPNGVPQYGETAYYDRNISESRVVVKWRDEEVVLDVADSFKDVLLQPGDLIRWRRDCYMALEKLERAEGRRFFLEEASDVGPEQVGGQGHNLQVLLSALTCILLEPKKALAYGLGGRLSILMVGPPGCGKTLMARVAASEVSRINGAKCWFASVKPGEFESPWVGVTTSNIREFFKACREAAKGGGYVIIFFDEIDAVGRTRGSAVGHHSDKFLAAFLAELDGFAKEDRKNVAIIAATNRKDLMDPALLERLSDIEITVSRPDQRAARAIFSIHLPPTFPFRTNGSNASTVRGEAIETAVSTFYSPNGDNELCVIRFRDGTTRTLTARELSSGRIFEQVARSARRAAFLRDVRGEDPGICVCDVQEAATGAIQRMRTMLTPRNAHVYLSDLSQDNDIVAVEPIKRKVDHPHRYLNLDVEQWL